MSNYVLRTNRQELPTAELSVEEVQEREKLRDIYQRAKLQIDEPLTPCKRELYLHVEFDRLNGKGIGNRMDNPSSKELLTADLEDQKDRDGFLISLKAHAANCPQCIVFPVDVLCINSTTA
jgi:hypothetical protein